MSWNYRVIRHRTTSPTEPGRVDEWYRIHEVYYDANGKPIGISDESICPGGETEADLALDVEGFVKATAMPVLDWFNIARIVETVNPCPYGQMRRLQDEVLRQSQELEQLRELLRQREQELARIEGRP